LKVRDLATALGVSSDEVIRLLENDRAAFRKRGFRLPTTLTAGMMIEAKLYRECHDRYVAPPKGAPPAKVPTANGIDLLDDPNLAPQELEANFAKAVSPEIKDLLTILGLAGGGIKRSVLFDAMQRGCKNLPKNFPSLAPKGPFSSAIELLSKNDLIMNIDGNIESHPELGEIMARDAVLDGRAEPLMAALTAAFQADSATPANRRGAPVFSMEERRARFRFAAFRGEMEEFLKLHDARERAYDRLDFEEQERPPAIGSVVAYPLDAKWLARFPPRARALGLMGIYAYEINNGTGNGHVYLAPLEENLSALKPLPVSPVFLLLDAAVLHGRAGLAEVVATLQGRSEPGGILAAGVSRFIAIGPSREAGDLMLKGYRAIDKDRSLRLPLESLPDLLVWVAFLCSLRMDERTGKSLRKLVTFPRRQAYLNDLGADVAARQLMAATENNAASRQLRYLVPHMENFDPFLSLVWFSAAWAFGPEAVKSLPQTLPALEKLSDTSRWEGIGPQVVALMGDLGIPVMSRFAPAAEPWHRAISIPAPWETAMREIERLAAPHAAGDGEPAPVVDRRLSWEVHVSTANGLIWVNPLEQRALKSGKWSKGKLCSIGSMLTGDTAWQTELDRRILGSAVKDASYYGRADYMLDIVKALPLLARHPSLVDPRDGEPVYLEIAQPQLSVVGAEGGELEMRLDPLPPEKGDFHILELSAGRYRVFHFDKTAKGLAAVLGAKGLRVPPAARERVERTVSALASTLTVQTDSQASIAAEARQSDSTPVLQLQLRGGNVLASMLVRPLGEGGPSLPPGDGAAHITARLEGKLVRTERDHPAESTRAQAFVDSCPCLLLEQEEGSLWHWTLSLDHGLEALSCARDAGDAVRVEWQGDRRMNVAARAGMQQVRASVHSASDWFTLSGEVRVDEGKVMELQDFVDLLSTATGRFVPLGDDRFLEVSEELRRRADDWRALSERTKDGLRFHPLAAGAIDASMEGAEEVQADRKFRDVLEGYARAQKLNPELPSTMRAELRPYQLDGYVWMMRLAEARLGACLADDMGLGKTVQALGMLIARAPLGPALVLAPMSVCLNWESEAARFAPTLRLRQLVGPDRAKIIADAGPFDVVVVSYGLLHIEADALAAKVWSTAILDEAQAIKNVATKRSQAAMSIQAGFRLAMSGTPVENHLGELWNLFRFINPGLLGSQERFNARFAVPIERDHDRMAMARLRRLVSPFLLRRTKQAVLEDLPPRTEITLKVEPDAEEMAFYESLRRKAMETLTKPEGAPTEQRIRILAELMKLRRACCNPELVAPGAGLPSSKLGEFTRIVEELRDNRHKALVFSQFVDHLTILRARLDKLGIKYQYLDGSTPQEERKRRVDAFQGGEGDFFLISLRAGGTGLNLTAADYVIHMDPWWNPAVEDQASDRAHRIGQNRPVTIYRIILKGTVEEKIVALHREKRDLAEGLLEGAEGGVRMSVSELLSLMEK